MKSQWILPCLAPAAAVLLYARTRHFGFVWDDELFTTLPVYRNAGLRQILTSPANGFEYLPVRDLNLVLDHRLYGSWPGGFHLENAALFALAVGLLSALYRALLARHLVEVGGSASRLAPALAAFCALGFALHPLQVEVVAFVTQRNALLALVLSVACLWCYAIHLERGGRAPYVASLALLFLALFSKATVVTLVGLLLLLHLYWEKDATLGAALRKLAPHLGVTVLALVIHMAVAQGAGALQPALAPAALLSRVPRVFFVAEFYVLKFLWPHPLTIEYDLDGYPASPSSTAPRPAITAMLAR